MVFCGINRQQLSTPFLFSGMFRHPLIAKESHITESVISGLIFVACVSK